MVATSKGLYRYLESEDRFASVLGSRDNLEAVRLRRDSHGRIWILFSNRIDRAELVRLDRPDLVTQIHDPRGNTLDFLIDSRDQIWVDGSGPFPIATLPSNIALPVNPEHMPVSHSMVGARGKLWLGTENGVLKRDHTESSAQSIELARSQSNWLSRFILYTKLDSRGGRWFGRDT